MLAEMPVEDFFEFRHLERVSPFTAERLEGAIALLGMQFCNLFIGKGGRKFKPEDFIVDWRKAADGEPEGLKFARWDATMREFAKAQAAYIENCKKQGVDPGRVVKRGKPGPINSSP